MIQVSWDHAFDLFHKLTNILSSRAGLLQVLCVMNEGQYSGGDKFSLSKVPSFQRGEKNETT